jgi:protein phosphatase
MATHAGRVRAVNEDAVVTEPPLFAVADGMGGHAAGEIASWLAVDAMRGVGAGGVVHPADVADAVRSANASVLRWATAGSGREGMGTTMTGLVLSRDGGRDVVVVFNVGDSRCYRWRHGALEQLSVDHSLVQELVSSGEITPEEARRHPQRNVVTRALGADEQLDVDVWLFDPVLGDRFVLCSDGLTTEVPDGELAGVLAGGDDADATCRRLVELALAHGGRDNVSVVVVDLVAVPQAQEGRAGDDEDTLPRRGRVGGQAGRP